MGRLSKFLVAMAAWRWTPCVGLAASSVLFVLLALLVVPSKLALGGAGHGKTLDLPDQPNSLSAPIAPTPERPLPTPPPRHTYTPPPAALPPPPPVPEPPPPRPEPEEKHEDPPPPPPPPPPAVTPAPAATEEEEEDQPEQPPAPTPRPGVTPLRFLPQVGRAITGLAPQPNVPPPADSEQPSGGEAAH